MTYMSKVRLRQIKESDTSLVSRIEDWNTEEKFFTLIDKEGKLARNDAGNAIVYKACLPDKDVAVLEAYAFMMYWAEEECDFKEMNALELLTESFTSKPITETEFPFIERENYKREFNLSINAKPLRKLRKAMVNFQECLDDLDKRVEKLADYMEDIFDGREDQFTEMPQEDFEEEEPEMEPDEYLEI